MLERAFSSQHIRSTELLNHSHASFLWIKPMTLVLNFLIFSTAFDTRPLPPWSHHHWFLWHCTFQIFLLMDGFEKLLALFRLGWSEVSAIFELRCLVFIKFGKCMANIFPSICFFFSDSFRDYNYSSVIMITYILLGFSFCLFLSFIVSFWKVSFAVTLNHFLLWYWVCH